jgi:hypothetical protein
MAHQPHDDHTGNGKFLAVCIIAITITALVGLVWQYITTVPVTLP